MSTLLLFVALLVRLPLAEAQSTLVVAPLAVVAQQAEPAHAAPAAHEAHDAHEAHEGEEHASGEHETLTPGEMFISLFKHLEPHAVAAVWFGGEKGFGFVDPYPTDAAGKPLEMEHGAPRPFHSSAELQHWYEGRLGGGKGLLIYNINRVQWLAAALLVVLLLIAASSARKLSGQSPRGGFYHVVESVVLYVRDDMVYAVMGKEHGRAFVPLFLTQFSFILAMNIFGLVWLPGGLAATATANLAVTAGLAITTFVAIHASGVKQHGFFHHWKNFVPHGLPWFVLPIIIPVEIIGMLVKPAALTVRLFANMLAGHLVMLSFFGLVYMFGVWALPALAMAFAISVLELFVCFVQAYIFTYLSIIFVGASVHPEH